MKKKTQITRNIKSGFDSERYRKRLLNSGKINMLLKTYSNKFPSIKDENSGKFWDQRFQEKTEINHAMANDRNSIVSNQVSKKNKVLNLGAGAGKLEEQVLRKVGKDIFWIGTDITFDSLTNLKKTYPFWKFQKEKLEKLSFNNCSFDLIFLLEVLEHITPANTFQVLAEIHRVLKKNETLILSIPVNEELEEMYPKNPNAHLRVYSEGLIKFELVYSGFEIKQIIKLTAFNKFYYIKKMINNISNLKHPNNLILIAQKRERCEICGKFKR